MKQAVIYARYSSYGQTEQSIDGQVRVCEEYAKNNGYIVINKYIDRATTGTNTNRPAFLQMIQDARSQEFTHIICYKLDRFARNQYDSVIYKHRLKELGIRVVSATEVINDSAEGRLMECILEAMAEMFSEDLSQKVKRGLKESVLKGTFTGGYILFGYKVVNKHVEIDELNAQIVRQIFEDYANGKSKKEIVEDLNKKGIKTSAKKPFVINSLYNLLTNRKYIGENYYNGELTEHGYPQIIERDLFEKVQKSLNKRKHKQAKYKAIEEYLLSGKAYCGLCGSPLVGTAGTSKSGERHYYYNCARKYKDHTCTLHSLQKKQLESDVIDNTMCNIFNEKIMKRLCKQLEEYYNTVIDNSKCDLLDKQIKNIDSKLDKLTIAIVDADSVEIRKRLNLEAKDLEAQKLDLSQELQKLKIINNLKHTAKDFENYFLLLAEKAENNNFNKFLVNSFINSVWVYDDCVLVFYNIFDDKVITKEVADSFRDKKSTDEIISANNGVRIPLILA